SGMKAVKASLLGIAEAGNHVIASMHSFGATSAIINDLWRYGITVSQIDGVDPDEWRREIKLHQNTIALLCENVPNPLLGLLPPVREIAKIAHENGAYFIVDTSMTTS